jgi:hypothetical protein
VSPNEENAEQRNDRAEGQDQPDPFAKCEYPPVRIEPVIISSSPRHFLK